MVKITIKDIPKKKNSGASDKKEEEVREEALKIVKRRRILNIGLAVLFLLLFLFGSSIIYLNSVESRPAFIQNNAFFQKIMQINNNIFSKQENNQPAATVNDQIITMEELDERFNTVPVSYQQYITKQDVLSQLIDEKLLLQEAKKRNMSASGDEINQMIDEILIQNQVSKEEFEQALSENNISIDYFEKYYGERIVLTKLLNETVISKIKVPEPEIEDYYETNLDSFKIPESVNVSHILICHNESERCVSNLTKEEALEMAKKVRSMINNTNFGEIALNYSNEPAAIVTQGNLGWVSIEDPFDQTFLNATFELNKGEISQPIETIFGYHLIKVFDKRNAETLNLTVVYSQINQTIKAEKQTLAITDYISELRNESVINTFI